MLQLRLVLFGVALIGSIGFAVYNHYKNRQQQQGYTYGHRPDDSDIGGNGIISYNESQSTRRRRNPRRSKDSTCSICLSNVPSNSERVLECGHIFHAYCIQVWIDEKASCPNCRTNVNQ